MLDALVGVIESLSTIGRAFANFFNGLIALFGFISRATVFITTFIDYVIPLPLRVLVFAVVAVSTVYLVVGRQH